jgi:hypothetical protein
MEEGHEHIDMVTISDHDSPEDGNPTERALDSISSPVVIPEAIILSVHVPSGKRGSPLSVGKGRGEKYPDGILELLLGGSLVRGPIQTGKGPDSPQAAKVPPQKEQHLLRLARSCAEKPTRLRNFGRSRPRAGPGEIQQQAFTAPTGSLRKDTIIA